MKQIIHGNHFNDPQGNPAGGVTEATGIQIKWQNGPLGRREDGTRIAPNGAFVEGVIAAAVDRLEYYQRSKFSCNDNNEAIKHLNIALEWLEARTAKREAQKVEGTHNLHK